LMELKAPIPTPDPKAVAWMTAEQNAPRPKNSLIKKPVKLFSGGPSGEIRVSARNGLPTMTPESEAPGTEILAGGTPARGAGNSIVATVATGGSAPTGSAENTAGNEGSGAEATSGTDGSTTPPASDPNASTTAPATGASSANGDAVKSDAAKPADGQAQDGTANGDSKTNPKKESTSKKKKGLRKIVPW